MRILIVIPGYEPAWALGGVVTSTAMLARALVSIGHQVSVFTTNSDGLGGEINVPLETPILRGGVETYYFRSTLRTGSLFDSRRLIRHLRESVGEFDIVYLAATYQWMGIEIPWIAQRDGVPVVMFMSGALDKRHLRKHWLKKAIWLKLFLSPALDRCAALHLVGEHERLSSRPYIDRWPHFMAPHCLDIDKLRDEDEANSGYRNAYAIDQGTPVLLAAGRYDALKRIDILLRSLALLQESHDFHLIIAGDYRSRRATGLINLVEDLSLRSRVHWAGLVPHDDMHRFYSSGDLFIHLSEDENFGMVVAEAMASGLPILTSPGVGIWDAVCDEDVGVCVELDYQMVAEVLKSFLQDAEEWRRRGDRAREVSARFFSPASVAAVMAKAFTDVIYGTYSPQCKWFVP